MNIETQIILLVVVALAFYLFGLFAGKSSVSEEDYDEGYSDGWKGRQGEVDRLKVAERSLVEYRHEQGLMFDLLGALGELPIADVPEPLRTAYLRAKGLDV